MSDNRKTSYAFVVYEESTDIELMRSVLSSTHLACAISPLHDRDVFTKADVLDYENRSKKKRGYDLGVDPWEDLHKPVEGALKKPHYHVIISFGRQKKSREQVLEIVHRFQPKLNYVLPLDSMSGYTKYLIHKCDKDKAQYSPNDVETYGGFNRAPLFMSTDGLERQGDLKRVLGWCSKYGIVTLPELFEVLDNLDEPAVFDAVCEKSYLIRGYLTDLQLIQSGAIKRTIDPSLVAKSIRDGVDYKADVSDFKVVA